MGRIKNKKLKGVYTVEATLTVPIFVIVVLTATMLFKLVSMMSYAESMTYLTLNDFEEKIYVYNSYELRDFLFDSLENTKEEIDIDLEQGEDFYNLITKDFNKGVNYYSQSKEDLYSNVNMNLSSLLEDFKKENENMSKEECEEVLRYTFDRLLKENNKYCKNENLTMSCIDATAKKDGDMFEVTFRVKYGVKLPFALLGRNSVSTTEKITVAMFSM